MDSDGDENPESEESVCLALTESCEAPRSSGGRAVGADPTLLDGFNSPDCCAAAGTAARAERTPRTTVQLGPTTSFPDCFAARDEEVDEDARSGHHAAVVPPPRRDPFSWVSGTTVLSQTVAAPPCSRATSRPSGARDSVPDQVGPNGRGNREHDYEIVGGSAISRNNSAPPGETPPFEEADPAVSTGIGPCSPAPPRYSAPPGSISSGRRSRVLSLGEQPPTSFAGAARGGCVSPLVWSRGSTPPFGGPIEDPMEGVPDCDETMVSAPEVGAPFAPDPRPALSPFRVPEQCTDTLVTTQSMDIDDSTPHRLARTDNYVKEEP
ncbi:MAG: hypothetical protein CME32_23010 [Gimesia sp.]|nr:hypothetical protein [Gimesia sp.]